MHDLYVGSCSVYACVCVIRRFESHYIDLVDFRPLLVGVGRLLVGSP